MAELRLSFYDTVDKIHKDSGTVFSPIFLTFGDDNDSLVAVH